MAVRRRKVLIIYIIKIIILYINKIYCFHLTYPTYPNPIQYTRTDLINVAETDKDYITICHQNLYIATSLRDELYSMYCAVHF